MKPTTIINLYGGPGAGKSTLAARLFYELKTRGGKSVELIAEAAKEDAWIGKPPYQPDIFFEQARRVVRLCGHVDVVISDSPLLLSALYGGDKWKPLVSAVETSLVADGHRIVSCNLVRTKAYQPEGRYQTEEQAQEVDLALQKFLNGRRMLRGTSDALIKQILSEVT